MPKDENDEKKFAENKIAEKKYCRKKKMPTGKNTER